MEPGFGTSLCLDWVAGPLGAGAPIAPPPLATGDNNDDIKQDRAKVS